MTLGERICKYRTEKKMSQTDLADVLEVSRQSISKWETDGSVPELDKLIKLSQVFGITLDELILDQKQQEQPAASAAKIIYVEKPAPSSAQKIAGVVLLCFSALLWLMIALFGDVLAGLVLAAPFAGCGLICLLVRKDALLWCCWVIYLFIEIYLRFATGVNWQYVFFPQVYSAKMTIHLIVAWCLLAVCAVLTVVTALRTRKRFPGSVRSELIGTMSGWAVYLMSWVIFAHVAYEARNAIVYSQSYRYVAAVSGWVRGIILIVALVFTVRLMAALIVKKKAA